MSSKDRDIDALLRRNVERQLADFDWEELRQRIGGRVTNVSAQSRSWARHGKWVAIAAGVALTAGVLTFAVISATGPEPGDSAMGEAKVTMIENAHSAGMAQVSFERADKPARCEVTILALDKPQQQKSRTRASWYIIAAHDLSFEKPRNGRDASDVLCLF